METSGAVQVAAAPDGATIYRLAIPPEGLPAVRSRDLAAAWDAAREGRAGRNGGRRRGSASTGSMAR